MKLRFFILSLAAVAALAFSACEVDGDSDATETVNPGETSTCTLTCTAPQVLNSATCKCEDPKAAYRYVRVDDQSSRTDGDNPGADIDAFLLQKSGGGVFYAQQVVESQLLLNSNDRDVSQVLNAPDAFYAFPDVSVCNADAGFVGLGGAGGWIIVSMQADMEVGDTLHVLEVSNCAYNSDGDQAKDDPFNVLVSVAGDYNGTWQPVANGTGDVSVTFNANHLP